MNVILPTDLILNRPRIPVTAICLCGASKILSHAAVQGQGAMDLGRVPIVYDFLPQESDKQKDTGLGGVSCHGLTCLIF